MGIRLRIVLLMLLGLAPLIAIRTQELRSQRLERIQAAHEHALALARRGVERQQELIGEARTLLEVISRIPDVANGSPGACQAILSGIGLQRPWIKGFWVVEPSGVVACSTAPGGIGLDMAERPYFRRAVEARGFVLNDYIVGRLRGYPAAIASLPRFDQAGNLQKIFMVSVDLAWLGTIAAEVGRTAGAVTLLVDSTGTILARHPDLQNWVGNNFAAHPLVQAVLSAPEGQIEMEELDGVPRIFGFRQLPSSEGRLAIGLPKADVLAYVDRQIWFAYLDLALVGALVLAAVSLGGEAFLSRPMRGLAQAAARLGAGDLTARAPASSQAGEFKVLAQAFNEMADRLGARESELRSANGRLEFLASADPLTGLANRRRFDEQLERDWRVATETGQPLTVLLIDVDYFKGFNDRYGHLAGDECLQAVAASLRAVVRRDLDLVARYGGEEFAVLLPDLDESEALAVADRLCAAVHALSIEHLDAPLKQVTISIGAASQSPGAGATSRTLLQAADAALYAAKGCGRNRVQTASQAVGLVSLPAVSPRLRSVG